MDLKFGCQQFEERKGNAINTTSMQKGIDQSEMILLLLTPGIFQKERVHVWKNELLYAMQTKRPFVLVRRR